ncbi:MAG: ABC transporter substrate-binding protein [Burkholderiales bacterium]|nr:ABC transporter substrate-binding protein [Burkholderiales bacterium]
MTKRLLPFLLWLLMFVPAAAATAATAAAAEPPDRLIERLSNEILERIRTDAALKAGDRKKLDELVDNTVMPHVDFRRMTALSVGRNWRTATPEQQQQLMDEFRALLIRTYAGALSSVADQKVRMRPLRANPQDTDVIVRSEVVQPRGEPIQLDYRMARRTDGWKIYDVNVLGVWLVETYRTQFAQEVSTGGIEGLIRSLSEKNRQPAANGKT